MRRPIAQAVLVLAAILVRSLVVRADPVVIEWVTVGDPCNEPDTEVMNDGTTGYGAVAYEYGGVKSFLENYPLDSGRKRACHDVGATAGFGLAIPVSGWHGLCFCGST